MSYTDVNGNEFESFEAACNYYGVDTPAQVADEDAYWAKLEQIDEEWATLMGEPLPWVAHPSDVVYPGEADHFPPPPADLPDDDELPF